MVAIYLRLDMIVNLSEAAKEYCVSLITPRRKPHFLLERFGCDGVLHLTMEGRRGAYERQSALSVLRRHAGFQALS